MSDIENQRRLDFMTAERDYYRAELAAARKQEASQTRAAVTAWAAADRARAERDKWQRVAVEATAARDQQQEAKDKARAELRECQKRYEEADRDRCKFHANYESADRDRQMLTSEVMELSERLKQAEAERDAYRKAKQENDERFQLEAAEQCARANKAEAELADMRKWRDFYRAQAERMNDALAALRDSAEADWDCPTYVTRALEKLL